MKENDLIKKVQSGSLLLYDKTKYLECGFLESNLFLPYNKIRILLGLICFFTWNLCSRFFYDNKV